MSSSSFSFYVIFAFLCKSSFSLPGNVSDHQSLLSLKANMIGDPLRSWNESTHFCNWVGITCGHKHHRVVTIDLNSSNLQGSLSPAIGNLTFLRYLMLTNNTLRGVIPKEIGRLTRLKVLNLGYNVFSGEIPKNISHCVNLIYLSLGANSLTGKFPLEFQSLSKLEALGVFANHLTGEIPAYIGNFSSLEKLAFDENYFTGKIPTSFGSLQKLFILSVYTNHLTSTIPISIFNLSSLEEVIAQENQLEGHLPSNLFSTLPNLEFINIGNNLLTGRLPISISNATTLWYFDVRDNGFIGGVPSFSRLKRLKILALDENPLGNGKSTDLDFLLSSLLNSSATLVALMVNSCNFGGVLPRYIGNFSELDSFQMGRNVISGYIPSEIHLLVNLEYLYLSENQLSGTIPSSLGSFPQLMYLGLYGNNLFGEIPFSLGNLSFLSQLNLGFNNLQGTIPISLGKSKNLLKLYLFGNKLQGNLPNVLFNPLSSLLYLDLSDNNFDGPLPLEIGGLKNLVSLDLSKNMFLGTLPSTLGTLSSLTELNISRNLFHGLIPLSFSSLKSLEILDLSSNNLTGEIPEFLGKLEYLKQLNLSSNHLEGELPTQGIFKNETEVELGGNTNLCGGIPQFGLPKCMREGKRQHLSHTQKLAILISSGGILFLIIVVLIVFIYKRKNKQSLTFDATTGIMPKLSYWSIQKATNGFSESNIIGSGKFSTVYKGILDGSLAIVAIKVLNLQVRGASKSFLAECGALRQIRHRNLVKVLTSCSSIDHEGNEFKAIVYEYMINGNLDNWLHNNHSTDMEENHDSKILNLLQRLNITIDVANALDYLHNRLETLLVHCDLKPSNILLDGDLVARVGDFGLAKFLPFKPTQASTSEQMSSTGIKGTIGYTAPEYGMGSPLSTCGDMYSYGILLLEIFTGKNPTSDVFSSGLTLHNYVKVAIPEQVIAIIDPKLFHNKIDATPRNLVHRDQILECLVSIFKIGIACSVDLPRERLNIGCAIKELLTVKDKLMELGGFETIPV